MLATYGEGDKGRINTEFSLRTSRASGLFGTSRHFPGSRFQVSGELVHHRVEEVMTVGDTMM